VSGFPGLRIGHAADAGLKSGVTVFLPDEPAVAAVHVSGGAPASRETDLLRPGNLVERVDAVVLSGGSAFGLAAADGAAAWLIRRNRGFAVGAARVPIVPGSALFDLANGGAKEPIAEARADSIYRALGLSACEAAGAPGESGSVGAGAGATTADLKGGFGVAESTLADGTRLAAFAAVNALGRVTLGTTPHFRAAPFERNREFGGLGIPESLPADAADMVVKSTEPLASTTLALIATDCALSRSDARRLAVAAHDGIALAVFPAHTPFDGDTVYAMATAQRGAPAGPHALLSLCAAAAATLARAIAKAVYTAESSDSDLLPTWRARYGMRRPDDL
jgi:L-aminopeptidase/D-esterase-like protein